MSAGVGASGGSRGLLTQCPSGSAHYSRTQIQALTAEVREMREMMLLAMIKNFLAMGCFRASSLTKEIPRVGARVVGALLRTLNNSPNVNVRLVTLEVLSSILFKEVPEFRISSSESLPLIDYHDWHFDCAKDFTPKYIQERFAQPSEVILAS